MKKLIILRGNSGSGKTTIAKELQNRFGRNTMLISQDVIRRDTERFGDSRVKIMDLGETGMIKNEYMVTWKLYREWLMENKTKGAKLVFLVFWSLMAIVLFIMSFFGGLSWFFLLMAVFCVYRAFFRDYIAARKQYAQLAKIYGCESWLRTITISNTDIMLEEGNSSIQCQCADVARVIEKGDKIWLVMNSNTVIRLYKSAFTEGSWEECKELFQKKNYE